MANERPPKRKDEAVELLKSLLIVELAKAKVPHQQIRRIVGCDMRRVTKIARFFKEKKEKKSGKPPKA